MSRNKCKVLGENWKMILSVLVREAEQLARSVERERKLDVETLVQSLVLGCLDKADASLRDFVQVAQGLGVCVEVSSFHERITSRLVMLLAVLFDLSLRHRLPSPLPITRLREFRGVFVLDSTQITVSARLYEVFCGAKQAAKMKLHVGLNYLTGDLMLVDCVAGRVPDQQFAQWGRLLVSGALLLFDLGYFKQEILQTIQQVAAFFVTRCQSQVALYDLHSGQVIDLLADLSHNHSTHFEGCFALGSRVHTPVRVIARRVDEQTATARRRQAKRRAKQQGQTCRQSYLDSQAWQIIITNLPSTWSAEEVWDLYGLRWQIELLFKVWKSQLGIARLGPWRPERVLCQFYAHLIGALLCQQTVSLFRAASHPLTSLSKAVSVIQQTIPRLWSLIRHQWRGLHSWAQQLGADLARFAQHQKRKTNPTTLQILMDWG